MSTFRNAEGDVLDVPDELAAFVAARGFVRDEPAPADVAVAAPESPAPPIPAATTPDPAVGDNDSEGVTNNA
jgi:hypothetical protein